MGGGYESRVYISGVRACKSLDNSAAGYKSSGLSENLPVIRGDFQQDPKQRLDFKSNVWTFKRPIGVGGVSARTPRTSRVALQNHLIIIDNA